MHAKRLSNLFTVFGTLAISIALMTGCGGGSGPKAVSKDIDVAALMDQLTSDNSQDRTD